ncbi:hypothetical protein OLZ32_08075 [Rhizobium sp. 1AS11]|uniref:hypothetical protein n=1 Tax=Rhizobium acaciae TaxID=2989736 RepID=UPI0022235D27|nr:hypothetical protein [Rhizobium acaciae]MCW1408216.1 hypothetical protein [Rhizobium acaciae]MCW1740367.1 hypothetical protein [Rhizobium acaciae]
MPLTRKTIFLAGYLYLVFGAVCYSQDLFAPFSSPLAKDGGQIFGQAVGVTSIVFGPEPKGQPEVILFSGLLEIRKSPVLSLNSSQRQIAIQFDSRSPSGVVLARSAATTLGFVKVAVDPTKEFRSVGILTEVPSSAHHGHEAANGTAKLYLVFEPGLDFHGPAFGQLRNAEAVELSGHIHQIPPITKPLKLSRNMTPDELIKMMDDLGDADKWTGANDHPIALIDEKGQTQAWFTPYVHVTTLTGFCGDGVDNDVDQKIDEENGDNGDDDHDGFVDEDSTCPK